MTLIKVIESQSDADHTVLCPVTGMEHRWKKAMRHLIGDGTSAIYKRSLICRNCMEIRND